jgi:large subunit ribosomal protein L5
MSQFKELYIKELAPKLMKELGLKNVMEVPQITKITLNMGVGEAIADKKSLESAVEDLTLIAGQKQLLQKQKNQLQDLRLEKDGR